MGRYFITAALPYANGKIHLGHLAGVYLPADVYARFLKTQNHEVFFLSGSDCYGVAITLKAEMEKRTPLSHVEHYHQINQDLFEKIGIEFTHFSSTLHPLHKEHVQRWFLTLLKNGYIEKRNVLHLYSEEEGRFLADRYVVGECPHCHYKEARGDECGGCSKLIEAEELISPRSKLTGSPLILKETTHYFFSLDRMKDWLFEWIETKKSQWKRSVYHLTKKAIESLRARSITRDLDWGVPVPGEPGKVIYVWFDAPIGYLSMADEAGCLDPYWMDPSIPYTAFIGKDNTLFHTLFFPAMIQGQDTPYRQMDQIIVSEFLNLNGGKFSKTGAETVDLDELLAKVQPDALRFYLALISPEQQDSDFSVEDLFRRVEGELIGKLGNYCYRVISFIHQKRSSELSFSGEESEEDFLFKQEMMHLLETVKKQYEQCSMKRAAESLLELAARGNRYIDQQKPWALLKEGQLSRLDQVLAMALWGVQLLAIGMTPLMPATALRLWHMMGKESMPSWDEGIALRIHRVNEPQILFHKLSEDSFGFKQDFPEFKEEIDFSDFEKIDLRIAKVLRCERVAKSDRLLKFELDVGGLTRTVLSGLATYFPNPSLLEGRFVTIVANLKPRKIMGIQSQGMILSILGEKGMSCELLSPQESLPGAQVL